MGFYKLTQKWLISHNYRSNYDTERTFIWNTFW